MTFRLHRLLTAPSSHPASREETGSEIVEMALVLLPLLAIVFLILDVSWICFAQASIQHAVQVGVRSAITGTLPSNFTGQDAYLKSVVQQNAMGFLTGPTGLNNISITYYKPDNLSTPVTGSGSNIGGNVVQISVSNVEVNSLGPIWRDSWATMYLKASASDVTESSVNGVPSPR